MISVVFANARIWHEQTHSFAGRELGEVEQFVLLLRVLERVPRQRGAVSLRRGRVQRHVGRVVVLVVHVLPAVGRQPELGEGRVVEAHDGDAVVALFLDEPPPAPSTAASRSSATFYLMK